MRIAYRLCLCASVFCFGSANADDDTKQESSVFDNVSVTSVSAAMKAATLYMTSKVAVHGGYVYSVSLDLKTRRGEGRASSTEIWVQPPGTPSVGIAFLRAFEATGDVTFLNAATECAMALVHGQLESGCWTDRIEFDPEGKNADRYRNGRGRKKGRNYSTLDDDKSQSAIRLLIEVDRALKFEDSVIHEAVQYALDALLKAQFANGGFPQGWDKPVESGAVVKASFPDYNWRTEGRFKNYWDFATLNDGLAGDVTETLQLAFETYHDQRYRDSLLRFGDFLILAQLPDPQPAWAQQYNHQMQPIWARKFEPPAVAGNESEDVIATLMYLFEITGEQRFLEPIPAAIAWIKRSFTPDGQLARFYELQTNKPLYFTKDDYQLTYDDSNVPTHYGFKSKSKVEKLEKRYLSLVSGKEPSVSKSNLKTLTKEAARIISELDSEGRWITDRSGKPTTSGVDKKPEELLIESEVFSKNLTRLAEYVLAARAATQ